MEKFKFLAKNKVTQLPKTPGVYACRKDAKLLYVGKAKNIRERVKNHDLTQIQQVGYIKTDSEIEALILEAKLIKKHQPKYNVVWRDDKNYFYICISQEDFPRVFITHQPKKDSHQVIGPFVEGTALKQTLKVLRRVFPFRSCRNLPRKSCLWYQLHRCPAPCLLRSKTAEQIPTAKIKMKQECQGNIKNLSKILQGKTKQTLNNLKKEMKRLSQKKEYERAAKIRNQIRSLERVLAHAHVFETIEVKPQGARLEAYDVSNIQGKQATGSMVTFINGQSNKSLYRKFKIKISGKPNDVAMLKEVLIRRFKHAEWDKPDLILIDGGRAQLNAAVSVTEIPVMALAKKKNELYIKGQPKPILLKKLPQGIANLILRARDEAHRFARQYHLKLRKKALLG